MSDRAALIDPVTGLSSRWHFDVILAFAFPLRKRDITITLVLCELRGLDAHVESLGVARDEVLSSVGERLREATRGVDVIARFGETRVVCLLVGSNGPGAAVFVDRMRDVLHPPAEEGLLKLAGGIAEAWEEMSTPDELIAAAERALENALAQGDSGVSIARA